METAKLSRRVVQVIVPVEDSEVKRGFYTKTFEMRANIVDRNTPVEREKLMV